MNYTIIPATLIIAFLVTLLISMFSGRSLGRLWLLFAIIFLATWAGQLWVPYGPSTWGIVWLPLILVPVFAGVLLLAGIPSLRVKSNDDAVRDTAVVLGLVFWIILIGLLIAIGIGYYRVPMA